MGRVASRRMEGLATSDMKARVTNIPPGSAAPLITPLYVFPSEQKRLRSLSSTISRSSGLINRVLFSDQLSPSHAGRRAARGHMHIAQLLPGCAAPFYVRVSLRSQQSLRYPDNTVVSRCDLWRQARQRLANAQSVKVQAEN